MTNLLASPLFGRLRTPLNDRLHKGLHNADMAKKPPSAELLAKFEEYRAASGWYLAAWRHYRNLTLDELAAEAGTSKGVVSQLETGAARKDGRLTRFNRTWLDLMAKALGTSGGYLIDVNPFAPDTDVEAMDKFRRVAPADKPRLLQIVDTFAKADEK